jgi:hypothetical protein
MKLVKKFFGLLWDAITEMNWTLSGTILVLITLSGETRDLGLKLFIASTVINLAQIMNSKHKESKEAANS